MGGYTQIILEHSGYRFDVAELVKLATNTINSKHEIPNPNHMLEHGYASEVSASNLLAHGFEIRSSS